MKKSKLCDKKIKNKDNFATESIEQVFNETVNFELKSNEKIIKCIDDIVNIDLNLIDTLIIGTKSKKIFSLDLEKYYNYTDLLNIDIKEHFYCKIKIFNWTNINTTISRNGDLVTKMYLQINLPSIYNSNIKIEKANTIKILIIYEDIINIFDYFENFDDLEQLNIAYENFNHKLTNLPCKIKNLSICSKIFSQSLDNLPINLEYLYINSNSFNSNLDLLPVKLKVISIVCNNFPNQLTNLPSELEILHIMAKTDLKCSFDYLPESIKFLYISCCDIQSNLQNLPIGLKILFIKTTTNNSTNSKKFNYLPKNLKQKYIDFSSNLV
jgi:hypothetical protein